MIQMLDKSWVVRWLHFSQLLQSAWTLLLPKKKILWNSNANFGGVLVLFFSLFVGNFLRNIVSVPISEHLWEWPFANIVFMRFYCHKLCFYNDVVIAAWLCSLVFTSVKCLTFITGNVHISLLSIVHYHSYYLYLLVPLPNTHLFFPLFHLPPIIL